MSEQGQGPVLPVADRHAPRRPHPHGALQLGVRAPHGRGLRLPDRGHGRGARLAGVLRAAARRAALARARLGRGPGGRRPVRPVPAERAARDLRRRRAEARRGRLRLRVVLDPRGGRGAPPRGRSRPQARATTGSTATSAPSRSPPTAPRGASPSSACACPTRTSPSSTSSAARSPSAPGRVPDFVIVRGNGEPLYTLVNPVDDALMKITHVLRGEDLLSSTPRQIALYRALAGARASRTASPRSRTSRW